MIRKADQETHFEDSTLRDLIQGLELESLPEFQRQHFDTCAKCQKRLESLAADSWWWESYRPVAPESDSKPADRGPFNSNLLDSTPPQTGETAEQIQAKTSIPNVRRLQQYEIESLIGGGGMGVVYKAHDTNLNRTVAIKMLLPNLANQPNVRKRFLREARSAAAISHEHVIDVFQVEANVRQPFLVMSWVPGETLEEIVVRDGAFSSADVIRYALQIASALAEAHRLDVVHRDIKPANILLDTDQDKAVITDFGLAKTVQDASLTQTGLIAGTPHYMSPEQCEGKAFTPKSDLFSLGGVMYFLATGETPFAAQHPMAIMNHICHNPVKDIRRVNKRIDATLAAVIHRLLENAPADRFSSAQELVDVLEPMQAHYDQPDVNPMPRVRPPKLWRRGFFRKPSLIEGAIIVTGLSCIVAKLIMPMLA